MTTTEPTPTDTTGPRSPDQVDYAAPSVCNTSTICRLKISTPKLKKNISLSDTEFQNAESDVERSKDNIKQSNPSDQPRIIELPFADDKVFDSDEDEGDNDEDVNNDEILIGDAYALTDFTINEYFEKYKKQTIISDDEMDYEENKENEAFGHLGFEELEKDDIRTKKKKTPLWRINKAASTC
nr:uncharacterized protein LOC115265123 [Aedes albopictus]